MKKNLIWVAVLLGAIAIHLTITHYRDQRAQDVQNVRSQVTNDTESFTGTVSLSPTISSNIAKAPVKE